MTGKRTNAKVAKAVMEWTPPTVDKAIQGIERVKGRLCQEGLLVARELQTRAVGVSEDMDHLAKRLAARDHRVNNLGVLQGEGPRVDVLCARLDTFRQVIEELQALVSDLKGEGEPK